MKITKQHKEACKRMLQSKDWQIVAELLQDHIRKIIDMRELTSEEKNMSKDSVWVGRNAAYISLKGFLYKIGILGKSTDRQEENWE
jgi:acyl-CoA hydrolase